VNLSKSREANGESQRAGEIRLQRRPLGSKPAESFWRHQPHKVRSNIFEKSEKKSCHPIGTPLFLTAKPNPTNGETNDKKRAL
jgi:hypothetical protein